MRLLDRLAGCIHRYSGLSLAVVVVGAVACGGVTYRWSVTTQDAALLALLQGRADRVQSNLHDMTVDSKAMGAVIVTGKLGVGVRQAALSTRHMFLGTHPAREDLRLLGNVVGADKAFVTNDEGLITDEWDAGGAQVSGQDVSFRPYFLAGIRGQPNVHAGVSLSVGRRMLFVAAPVAGDPSEAGSLRGVVVARFEMTELDRFLGEEAGMVGLLLSPDGVVMASNRSGWLMHHLGPLDAARLGLLNDRRQYGEAFVNPQLAKSLPAIADDHLRVDDDRYRVVTRPLHWNDPNGDWTLMLLSSPRLQDHALQPPLLAAAVGLMWALVLGWLHTSLLGVHRRAQLRARHQRDLTRQHEMDMARLNLSRFSVRLQQADTVEALMQVGFGAARELLGAFQGVGYETDAGKQDTLRLVGVMACPDLPADELAYGEGLLGECAYREHPAWLTARQTGMVVIRSGLGEMAATSMLMAPVRFHGDLLGVVELALVREPGPVERAMATELLEALSINWAALRQQAHARRALASLEQLRTAQTRQLDFQQALIDALPYAVFYKGADTRFLGFNRAYEHAFGVVRDELIGKRVLDLAYLPHDAREAFQAEDEAVIASGASLRRIEVLQYADGRAHRVVYTVTGIRWPDGMPAGLVGTLTDLDEAVAVPNAEVPS